MRSLALDFERKRVGEIELPEPDTPGPTDVLFRVHEVGVCGTDREIAAFRIGRPNLGTSRLVIGHEALGQVIETGAQVRNLKPGDWVVPMIRRPCAKPCPSCARGRADLCLTLAYKERGIFDADGYFTEYAADPEQFLVPVPENVIHRAVLLEPLSVVEKGVNRAISVRQVDLNSALVLGLGPIGMLSALLLAARGYAVSLYSREPEDHPRAKLVRQHGIAYTTQLGRPADLIIEAAGSAELALEAVRLLAPAGVFVTLGAWRAAGEFSFIDLIVKNQTVIGSVNSNRESFDAALRDLPILPGAALDRMIRRFAFEDYRKTLLEPGGNEPKFVHVMPGG